MPSTEASAAPVQIAYLMIRGPMLVIGIDCHKDDLSACLVDHLGTVMAIIDFPQSRSPEYPTLGWLVLG